MPIKISDLDHIVLNVSDIHRSLDFYMIVIAVWAVNVLGVAFLRRGHATASPSTATSTGR